MKVLARVAVIALITCGLVVGAGVALLVSRSEGPGASTQCVTRPIPPAAVTADLLREGAQPTPSISVFPLGLRCSYPRANGAMVTVDPDFGLTWFTGLSVALVSSGVTIQIVLSRRERTARNRRRNWRVTHLSSTP